MKLSRTDVGAAVSVLANGVAINTREPLCRGFGGCGHTVPGSSGRHVCDGRPAGGFVWRRLGS